MGRLPVPRAAASARVLIVHPASGEVLPDDLDRLVELEEVVDRYLRSQRPHYEFRRHLREKIAELRGEPVLPRMRYRTETQQKVAECPRCNVRTKKGA